LNGQDILHGWVNWPANQARLSTDLFPILVFREDVVVPACSCAHGRLCCLVLDLPVNLFLELDEIRPYAEIRTASPDLAGHPVYHKADRAVMMVAPDALLDVLLAAVLGKVPVGLAVVR
jgi:hypothetical protein